jgi:hypothetical protein
MDTVAINKTSINAHLKDGRISIYQPEQTGLIFPQILDFENFEAERQHLKERLVASCRAFSMYGLTMDLRVI